MRSGRPSPSMSLATGNAPRVPPENVTGAANELEEITPVVLMFSKTETKLEPQIFPQCRSLVAHPAVTRSGRPSPLKSIIKRTCGQPPTAKLTGGAKELV